MAKAAMLLLFALSLMGCAYKVDPQTQPAVNIYTTYEDKLPGNYVFVADDSLKNIKRDVKPSSFVCSAHTYPTEIGPSLVASLNSTLQKVADNVQMAESGVSIEKVSGTTMQRSVFVRLDTFSPRLSCSPGFWQGYCTASADISLGVTVTGPEGRLFSSSVGSSRSADGDAGQACDGGAKVLSQAIELTMRDTMERMAERLAASTKLREMPDIDKVVPAAGKPQEQKQAKAGKQ
jgi:hypothetical protein